MIVELRAEKDMEFGSRDKRKEIFKKTRKNTDPYMCSYQRRQCIQMRARRGYIVKGGSGVSVDVNGVKRHES
jgi:hypothetical protein